MSFKDYFEMGRKSEIEYERKKRVKQSVKKVSKPSPFSPAGIVVGIGVLYQIIVSKLAKPSTVLPAKRESTMSVIKTDIKMLVMRIRGLNKDWEKYKQFDEFARRGMK